MKPTSDKFVTNSQKATEISVFLCASVAMLILVISTTSCSQDHEPVIESEPPEYIQDIENVSIIAPIEGAVPDTVKLIQEAVFESNDEVFIEGYISKLAVDKNNRVYIAATMPGTVGIYVFEPNGRFIDKFVREGRGPGEYESITSMQIVQDTIYVLDGRAQKMGLFSVSDRSHIRDHILSRDQLTRSDSLASLLRGRQITVTEDNDYILNMWRISASNASDIPVEAFFRVSEQGEILPQKVLEVDRFPFYFPVETGRLELPFPMPFTRSSLVSITKNGRFYTNWTDDFLIKIYNRDGEYDRALYHQVRKSKLDMGNFELSRLRERSLAQYEMPETWPAVHTMELDDEERLWVATITDSDSTFQWHVINPEGELLARFQKPGSRTSRSVMSKPLHLVQNGYFYSRERDIQQGIDRIVKYRIEFVES